LEWSCCLCLRATRSNALWEDTILVIFINVHWSCLFYPGHVYVIC
jgi:hypothetical protein